MRKWKAREGKGREGKGTGSEEYILIGGYNTVKPKT
jgi:hypothetical protein